MLQRPPIFKGLAATDAESGADDATAEFRQIIDSLRLPGALEELDSPAAVPARLRERARALRADGVL